MSKMEDVTSESAEQTLKLPKGHQNDIDAMKGKRKRQEECDIELDALINGRMQPFSESARDYIYESLDYPNTIIKRSLGRHTNRLAYLELIMRSECGYGFDGSTQPISDKTKADIQARIDGWADHWAKRTADEIQKRKNRDMNYKQFLKREKYREKVALKHGKKPAEVSGEDSGVIAPVKTLEPVREAPVRRRPTITLKKRRIFTIPEEAA